MLTPFIITPQNVKHFQIKKNAEIKIIYFNFLTALTTVGTTNHPRPWANYPAKTDSDAPGRQARASLHERALTSWETSITRRDIAARGKPKQLWFFQTDCFQWDRLTRQTMRYKRSVASCLSCTAVENYRFLWRVLTKPIQYLQYVPGYKHITPFSSVTDIWGCARRINAAVKLCIWNKK